MALGVSSSEFWEMSLDEMIALIDGHREWKLEETKTRAQMDYVLADLNKCGFNNPKEFPKNVFEAYPFLFEKEAEQRQTLDHYNHMKLIQQQHNKKIGGE